MSGLASTVIVNNGQIKGIETKTGGRFDYDYLVLAPGREGTDWLSTEAKRLNLTMHNNPINVGIRVELPVAVMEGLTDVLYEVKLEFLLKSFDDRIETFCMCPAGEVIMESTGSTHLVITVNGHSYADRRSSNTYFALLVSTTFTELFQEPIAYGKCLARLANILSGGVLVQPTLKSATPGDLSFVIPYPHLIEIIEMLQAMDKLAPGVSSHHTLLYEVKVKFYSCRPQLSPSLETEISNMFIAGDGAGISRGLIETSASGVVATREILRRNGH